MKKFDKMKQRFVDNKEIFKNKKDLNKTLTHMLMPNKKVIEEQMTCDCGPQKMSMLQMR